MSKRPADFAAAALRLTARGGLEAVSIRTVAAEAGWSAGALQKVFATKEDLLAAAVDLMSQRVIDRMAGLEATGEVVADLAALVRETLPLDRTRRDEALVWTAVAGRAATVDWMADVLRAQDAAVLTELTEAVRQARPSEPAPSAVADAVVALADGWTVRLLYAPEIAPAALTALDRALELLLGSPVARST